MDPSWVFARDDGMFVVNLASPVEESDFSSFQQTLTRKRPRVAVFGNEGSLGPMHGYDGDDTSLIP